MECKVFENANCFKLIGHSNGSAGGGFRKEIKAFSKASRRRLLYKFNCIDTSFIFGDPIFLTLTYPRDSAYQKSDTKRHLDNFLKYLKRLLPDSFFIWRLEYQKRGAPHYHIVAFNTNKKKKYPKLSDLRNSISSAWYRIVDSSDPAHLLAGTNVEKVKNWTHLSRYISKYMAKIESNLSDEELSTCPGRFWGIVNRDLMPITQLDIPLTRAQFYALRRMAVKFLNSKTKKNYKIFSASHGFMLFIDNETAFRILNCYLL